MTLPATLGHDSITAIIDTREQMPLDLAPLQTVTDTLSSGDYSVRGLERYIAIERKSLPDLLACCGSERERFEREIMRLLAYPVRALVVESTWPEIERGEWRSQIKPSVVVGSLLGWSAMGLPLLLVGDHATAGRYVARLLYTAARRRYAECRELLGLVQHRSKPTKEPARIGGPTT